MCIIYTRIYTQAYKKNEIIPFEATWMDLEIIILRQVSQIKRTVLQTHRENKLMVSKGQREKE